MNEKEIAEIRRRFKLGTSNITHIRGCYVNEKREIIAQFNQSVALLPEDETEKFLAVLKRTLAGTLEKNLLNIEFSTKQVVQSPEHQLLMTLRGSSLQDEEAIQKFFEQVIQSVSMEDNYLILLAQDIYDVPFRSKGREPGEDAPTEVFNYMVCSICPVKMTKPGLSYHVRENEFHSRMIDRIVSPPEIGFMFPAFDDRSANLYASLYYSRDLSDNHPEFVEAVLGCTVPEPAAVQKEIFQTVLSNSLTEECNLEMVQAVQGYMQELIEENKADKEAEPLKISKGMAKRILQSSGASESGVASFEEKFDEAFGEDAYLSPQNIVDIKQCVLATPDVSIKVNPSRANLVETRIIDGIKYILIRADEGVEVNGVPISIS